MSRIRFYFPLAIAAVIGTTTAIACSDTKPTAVSAATPTRASTAEVVVTTAATRPAAARVDRAAVRERAARTRSRIPERFRWLGEEHNRLMLRGIVDYQRARSEAPDVARQMRRDCDWTLAFTRAQAPASAIAAGLAPRDVRGALEPAATLMRQSDGCRRRAMTPLTLFELATSAPQDAGAELSAQTIALLDGMLAQIDVAADEFAVYDAVDAAVAGAASLPASEAELVYAAASLTEGSAELWGSATDTGGMLYQNAPAAMALFRVATAKSFREFVIRDAKGCVATATVLVKYVPWQGVIAGCFIGGVANSLWYFLT